MLEPHWLLRGVTYHFASGQALWLGLVLLLLAVRGQGRRWRSGTVLLLSLLGLLWVALSGWPSMLMQPLLIGVVLIWLVRPALPTTWSVPSSRHLGYCVMASVIGVLLLELPWLIGRRLSETTIRELAVIGDSVTAGLNAQDVIWPRVLADTGVCTIWDASQQGATVQSASQQLARLQGRGDALLIEIGGNDLLEGLPLTLFESRLDMLLQSARSQYRTIVMLELPLPPLSNRYGLIQRRLAQRYQIPLIPKREFAAVLTTSGGTVDGIHLSDRGQARMADIVRYWLYVPHGTDTSQEYHRVDVR